MIMQDFVKQEERINLQPSEIAFIAKRMVEEEIERLKHNERLMRKADDHHQIRIKRLKENEKRIMKNLKFLYKKTGEDYGR